MAEAIKLVRDSMIEVPCTTKAGRPSYRWVQGWSVQWGENRRSIPMRYREAQRLIANERKNSK